MTKKAKRNTTFKKNKNFFKNIKITSSLLVLVIIAILSLGSMTFIALNNMETLSNDMNLLYEDRMLTSLELKHLETEFYIIRLQMSKMVYSNNYDENSVSLISQKREDLLRIFDNYRNLKMSEEQRKLFKDIENNYTVYLQAADSIIKKIKYGIEPSESAIKQLTDSAAIAQQNIDELVQLKADNAASVVEKANKVYASSRNIFIGLFIGVLAIFIILSIIITKLIKGSMAQINDVLKKLSEYDFNIKLEEDGKNEFAQMNKSLAIVVDNLKNVLKGVKDNSENLTSNSQSLAAVSEEMAASSQELANTMQQVADGATSQANDLTEIVNSLSQLTQNIENVYEQLKNVKDETDNTTDKANIGKEEMDKLVLSINEIKNSFEIVVQKVGNLTNSVKEISGITDVISGISEQTNLLALNAAIEAARAGEHGKGFAVVAEEVRKLAEESKKSTDEITKLVVSINSDTDEVIKTSNDVESFVKEQANSVQNTVKAFRDILVSVESIAPLMDNTYKGMDEIVKSKDEVMERVDEISAVTEENSAASEEVAASSEELTASTEEIASTAQTLSTMAEDLMDYVNRFKI
ncbi:methyl-accepting chemotaxis protein [Caldisalinibacter kiritimatiensis]|uniref:Methyl-accepting chemotaxis protein n=1 Tax=Caldisalinibacter kiritimatiensis TaxID=1304284 RepID=R1CHG4_9FIRM|nr:methyl-accepting chemotaxis protein [Caldisalinibacter kiritimatiensis]EOD01735.1 Methyl-accepting chemotaxis protein [Caldisalinibacter kiritimatiensis]